MYNTSHTLYRFHQAFGSKISGPSVLLGHPAMQARSRCEERDRHHPRQKAPKTQHCTGPHPQLALLDSLDHSHRRYSRPASRTSLAVSDGHLVPLARQHPQSHGVGPSRRRIDVVLLELGALEAVYSRHHLRHQAVMMTDDPQQCLLLLNTVADE